MNDYEILLMLDPELAEERQTEIVTRTKELVEKGSGSWLSHDVWGRRRLAYEIDHKTDGAYHLLQFDAEPATLGSILGIQLLEQQDAVGDALHLQVAVDRSQVVEEHDGALPGRKELL